MIMANARCCTLKPIQHCKAIFLQFKNKLKKDISEFLTIGYLTSGDRGIKKHKGIKLCDWKNDY